MPTMQACENEAAIPAHPLPDGSDDHVGEVHGAERIPDADDDGYGG